MEEQKIADFYKTWLERLPSLTNEYIYDENKKLLPLRQSFFAFKETIEKFLTNSLEEYEKIIILPGIRGIGKTTLLMQILKFEKFLEDKDINILTNVGRLDERLYLDVSKLKLEEISLNEFFKFYEKINDFNFENLNKKVLILLDEVHYDDNWGLFLKNIFDRTKGHKNILIIATGSSALNLRMNPDLSRRASVTEMHPMKFSEYLLLKHNMDLPKYLSDDLRQIIFNSHDAKQMYESLKTKSLLIDRIFINLSLYTEEEFFEIGSFPFTIHVTNKTKAAELIKNVITNIIHKDIISLKKFKTETIAKIYDLLYLLANSDVTSYEKLQKSLKTDGRTLDSLIEVLIMSGILIKIKSYGRGYGSTRKTPKLLFIAPSLRSAVLDNNFLPGIEGKKLEDYFALIYAKDLKEKFAYDLSYDAAERGADFVLTLKDRSKIVIEVGFNKEEVKQVENTQAKVKGKYGIVFGSGNLELVNDSIVKIPLKYFLLM